MERQDDFNDMEQQDDFRDMEQDYEYFQSLYPQTAKKIQQLIDDQCDQLEYSGSCMFDEIPDKVHLDTMIDNIYNRAVEMDKDNPELQAEEMSGNPLFPPVRPCSGLECTPPLTISDFNPYGRPNWLRYLIQTMLYNNLMYRRMRYRRRRRRRRY